MAETLIIAVPAPWAIPVSLQQESIEDGRFYGPSPTISIVI
jgi:hypothetical protein